MSSVDPFFVGFRGFQANFSLDEDLQRSSSSEEDGNNAKMQDQKESFLRRTSAFRRSVVSIETQAFEGFGDFRPFSPAEAAEVRSDAYPGLSLKFLQNLPSSPKVFNPMSVVSARTGQEASWGSPVGVYSAAKIHRAFLSKFPRERARSEEWRLPILSKEWIGKLCPFFQRSLEYQQRDPISFMWNGRQVTLSSQEHSSADSIHFVGRIEGNEPQLYRDILNGDILFKTFRDYWIISPPANKKVRPSCISNVLEQYLELSKLPSYSPSSMPVAKIYNFSDVKNGCGYFLIERISGRIPVEAILKNPTNYFLTVEQIRKLVSLAYSKKIDIDLSWENLRMRENGTIALMHPRPHKEMIYEGSAFDEFFFDMISKFCAGSKELEAILLEGLSGSR